MSTHNTEYYAEPETAVFLCGADVERILTGQTNWMTTRRDISFLGKFALGNKDTNSVVAVANLVTRFKLSEESYIQCSRLHGHDQGEFNDHRYSCIISDVQILDTPVPIRRKTKVAPTRPTLKEDEADLIRKSGKTLVAGPSDTLSRISDVIAQEAASPIYPWTSPPAQIFDRMDDIREKVETQGVTDPMEQTDVIYDAVSSIFGEKGYRVCNERFLSTPAVSRSLQRWNDLYRVDWDS